MSDAPLIKSTERLPTTPGRGSNHLNEGGKNSRVAIIGYLPDLHPLYRRENTSFSEPAATEADVSSPYTFSPSTPLISAFRAADPRKALSSWFREGSVRGSVFNLCSATLGAGALSLPYAFSKAGWVLGLIMLTLGGAATIFSIHLLFRARKATNCVSYEDLTVNIFGKCMGFIVELNILIFCFGTAVAYIIAVGDILEPVLIMTGVDRWILGLNATSNNHNNSFFFLTTATATTPSSALSPSSSSSFGDLTEAQEHTLRVVSMVTFFICIMFPLSLLEKINSLRFTSFFGVAAIFYLVFTTVYQSIETMVQQGWSFNTWAGTEFNTDLFSIVQAAPIIMFAFTCQVNVFSIYDELEKPSNRKMSKVTNYAILVCFSVYLFMGVFGYFHYGNGTKGNVLQNCFPTEDPMVVLSFAAITLTIVMAFPLVVFPCRYTLDVMLKHLFESNSSGNNSGGETGEIVFRSNNAEELDSGIIGYNTNNINEANVDVHPTTSKCRHLTLTTLICASALTIALFVSKIQIVFQLMGGTTSAFVCFILPAAFVLKLQQTKRLQLTTCEWWLSWCLASGGCVVGVLSTYVTLYNLIDSGRHN